MNDDVQRELAEWDRQYIDGPERPQCMCLAVVHVESHDGALRCSRESTGADANIGYGRVTLCTPCQQMYASYGMHTKWVPL